MNRTFDKDGIRDEEQYWDALASRVAVAAQRDARGGDVMAFAGSVRGLTAAAILVAIAAGGSLLLRDSGAAQSDELTAALEPSDDVGRAITASPAPPSVGALLLSNTGASR